MRLIREPLVQFTVLGAALFLVWAVASDLFAVDESRRIVMDEAEIEFLADGWQRQWQRLPTTDELQGLVDARVREEVLYREAQAMGLDVNDLVVRRRMVQKMDLLSQDLALLVDPTDQELRAFFAERPDDYTVPPRISFSHVYFNVDRRGAAVFEDAERVLAQLRSTTPQPERAPDLGDRFMLAYDYRLQAPAEVQRSFGSGFAEELLGLENGWQGPIGSGYGVHLVNITERVESRVPAYEEVRDRLVNDFNRVRRDRANEALYEGLSEGYTIEIDETAIEARALAR
ncbi:MAG: peptidyl-prolyl cis-trans isomerase [Gemmatimonadetes bacterium]|nr:peptidyl-prolyl cis-trans isomerase [Gemmatimonadota bacterium]MBT8477685.1 peptidyl-prolyl cis-trans isomerase [Gemmatimonadota bacterium]NNK48598.1 peptidyl-prolyl cis-trans isomerase [Gemmatimonadota bacterium]